MMRDLIQDLRHGLRLLARIPGFTAVAVLTLALGIGANTAIFSVVHAVLLRPLSLPSPERLVMVWENDRLRGTRQERASAPDFQDFRAQATVFEALSAWQSTDATLTGAGEPERLVAARVSANYFTLLGVPPLLGRAFLPEEEKIGRHRVAVLGHGLWRRRFGADRDILGKTVTLEGESFTVVGVAPARAALPLNAEELWAPLALQGSDLFRGVHRLRVYARLKPGIALEQAQIEMTAIMRRLEAAYPDDNQGRGAVVVSLHDQLVRDARPVLLLLEAAVGIVLLIACVNVASLLLARASGRSREIAVRAALGAGRGRILRQALAENLVLAVLGLGLGLLLAAWTVDLVRTAGPRDVPRLDQVGLNGQVLGFAALVTLLAWAVFTVAPALRLGRTDLMPVLREGGPGALGPAGRERLRHGLLIAEVALSTLLLIGAGLLIRSLARLAAVDPGFDPRNVVTLGLQLPPARYPMPRVWPILEWPQVTAFQDRLLETVSALPGVRSAALAVGTPASATWTTRMTVVGRPEPPPGHQDEVYYRPVSEDYFRAAGLPVLKGRGFDARDDGRRPLVVVINQSFAKRYFPDQDPLGQRVKLYGVAREVVGVAGDEKFLGLASEAPPAAYLPFRQGLLDSLSLIVRAAGDALALAPSLHKVIWSLDPNLAVFDVVTLEQALAESLAQRRFTMRLLGAFAALALLLAVVGIYGVVSSTVGRRTHEIGLRMALGAARRDVLRLVVRHVLLLTVAGVGLGLAAALALSRLLAGLLFGVGPRDPVTFLAAALILTGVALAAGFLPARRATRVDPMVALRYE